MLGLRNTIAVSLGDFLSETLTPINTLQVKISDWIPYTYNFIAPAAGAYVLRFSGTVPFVRFSETIPYSSGSDYTTYIDNVCIVPLVGPKSTRMSGGGAVSSTGSALPVYAIVFIGDSITAGATLANPGLESAAAQCAQSLRQRYSVAVRMSNQGHGGHTTVDWLPSSNPMSDFHLATAAAYALESNQPRQLVFSIMLGANDSAQSGPNGAPVAPGRYRQNLQAIIDHLLVAFPEAYVFVHCPVFYTTNTQNGSFYGPVGLARLRSYLPEIDQLVSSSGISNPGRVFAGDKAAFGYFSTNYLIDLTPEPGAQGTFCLHPNAAGAAVLGEDWADAIAAALDPRLLPMRVITHAAQIRNLSVAECAKSLPAHLLGVMMDKVETDSDRRAIVLQDQTAGIYM